jgi:hypothetical protein
MMARIKTHSLLGKNRSRHGGMSCKGRVVDCSIAGFIVVN